MTDSTGGVEAGQATEELRAERDFLLDRLVNKDSSWVGLSSNAMLAQVLTGGDYASWWPFDAGDLGRCEETYRRAPEHLKPAMLPILERFRRHVADGGLHCRGCDTSGHNHTRHNLCDECYGASS